MFSAGSSAFNRQGLCTGPVEADPGAVLVRCCWQPVEARRQLAIVAQADGEVRGFGAAAGNVVLGGARPSSKSDPLVAVPGGNQLEFRDKVNARCASSSPA